MDRTQHQHRIAAGFVALALGFVSPAVAGLIVNTGATVTVDGNLTTDVVEQAADSLIQGSGKIIAPVNLNGTLSAGPGTATLGTGSLNTQSNSAMAFEVNGGTTPGSDYDQVQVTGTVSLGTPTLQLSGTGADPAPGEEIMLLENDGTDAVNGSFSGYSEGSYLTLPGSGTTVEVSYTGGTGNDVVLRGLSLFQRWGLAKGLEHGVSDGLDDDPNNDGIKNLVHFANDTDPLGTAKEVRTRFAVADVDGNQYFTFTRPVRPGAVFSGTPAQASVDGVVYRISGSLDLVNFDQSVVEAGSTLDNGLPALSDIDGDGTPDWEYRTFRINLPVNSTNRAFIQDEILEAP